MELPPIVDKVVTYFTDPLLYPIMGQQRIYWQYLLVAFLIALCVYFFGDRGKHSFKAFLAYCFPKEVYLHDSAKDDYKYFVLNHVLVALLLLPFIGLLGFIPEEVMGFLGMVFTRPESATTTEQTVGLILIYTVVIALAMDFAVFITHYLQHRIRVLWEFHKVHHSAEVMTPMTVYRMHPIDLLLTLPTGTIFIGLTSGCFRFFICDGITQYIAMGLNGVVFFFYLLGYNLRHSHIWVSYGKKISHFLISPAQHQIHHSDNPKHWDKNMGFMFAFWDWMFGTLYVPKEEERGTLTFGIGPETKRFRGVGTLYTRPFKNVWKMFKKDLAKRKKAGDAGADGSSVDE